jgi:hypothetical protein
MRLLELGDDGELHEVARKSDFGSRIRNARTLAVTGLWEEAEHTFPLASRKDHGGDVIMEDAFKVDDELNIPEGIVFALECGDLVFVVPWPVSGKFEFITSRHTMAKPMLTEQPGRHLAVDPSSRYMAVACTEGLFAVYALKTPADIRAQQLQGIPFNPIDAERYLHIDGIIYKMEFIFPAKDDPEHIILLLVVVRRGKTWMHVFDWAAGNNLREIRCIDKQGYPVARDYRMPLLVIPLTSKSAVILISDQGGVICEGLVEGAPTYETLDLAIPSASPLHNGLGPPLWTSWARPLRTRSWSKSHDLLYLAREDGSVTLVELEIDDSAELMVVSGHLGLLNAKISTAFASLAGAGFMNDILVAGGDSGPGGVYEVSNLFLPPVLSTNLGKVCARRVAEVVVPIQNYSPILDFVIVRKHFANQDVGRSMKELIKEPLFFEQERLFACTGKPLYGAVTELRLGNEARIRFNAQLDVPPRGLWALPRQNTTQIDGESRQIWPLSIVLAVGNQSILLSLSENERNNQLIEEIEQSNSWLDLSSQTLLVTTCGQNLVQVTESSILMSATPVTQCGANSAIYRRDLNDMGRILTATCLGPTLAVVTQSKDANISLQLLHMNVSVASVDTATHQKPCATPSLSDIDGPQLLPQYPSCLTLVKLNDENLWCMVGLTENNTPLQALKGGVASSIAIFKLDHITGQLAKASAEFLQAYTQAGYEDGAAQDGCTSIEYLKPPEISHMAKQIVLLGYRSGLLVAMLVHVDDNGTIQLQEVFRGRFGTTPAIINTNVSCPQEAIVCCDSKLFRICYNGLGRRPFSITQIWMTDLDSPGIKQPLVDHVCVRPNCLLLVAKSQLLITTLNPKQMALPRHIEVPGSPIRLVFSPTLQALVTAVWENDRSSFVLIDESGSTLEAQTIETIPYWPFLGPPSVRSTGRLLCMAEWARFTFTTGSSNTLLDALPVPISDFFALEEMNAETCKITSIIIGTSQGGLVVFDFIRKTPPHGQNSVIIYRAGETYFNKPVYAVATFDSAPGLIFACVGHKAYVLTHVCSSSKISNRAEYRLPSHGVSISFDVESSRVQVLTAKHSLVTLKLTEKGSWDLSPEFIDEVSRPGLTQIQTANLVMVADKECSVAGLWHARSKGSHPRDHTLVFEAELPVSMLSFQRGRIRPTWDRAWQGEAIQGVIPTFGDDSELLGVSIDGSVTHFTILSEELWRLLGYLQNQIHKGAHAAAPSYDRMLYEEEDHSPQAKHIDGDLLRRFLTAQNLKALFEGDLGEARSNTFCDLVIAWYGNGIDQINVFESCLDQTYMLLETLLRQVL